MEPTKHSHKPRRDRFEDEPVAATEATDATEAQPLFTVERREVVGTVYKGGTERPVVVGYRIAAEAMTIGGGEQRFEFTWGGMTFTATGAPEATGK